MPNIGDIIRAEDINDIKSGGYIGQIIAYSSNLIPSNVLICDGSEISRDTYSELFAVINTIYGEGDGSTTFNIPDLRDKWVKYYGVENNLGDSIDEGLPNITGRFISVCLYNANGVSHGTSTDGNGVFSNYIASSPHTGGPYTYASGTVDVMTFDASRSSAIYGNSTHLTPNSIVLLPCIIYE